MMKKTIKYVVVACIMITGQGLNAQKLGHVNSQEIMEGLPLYTEAVNELRNLTETMQKELQMFEKLNQEELQKYQAEMESLAEDAKSRREADLLERNQNLQRKQYEFEQKLQTRNQELMTAVNQKVISAVKEVAEDEGYDYVYDENTLLYAGGEDISDKVRKKLGITVAGK